jgi:hypothetical protein
LHANAVIVVARGKGGGLLSDHASHVMLLCIFGNSFRLGVALTAPHFCTQGRQVALLAFAGAFGYRHVRRGSLGMGARRRASALLRAARRLRG